MQAIVKIFAFIGFVTILVYLTFRLWDYFKSQSDKADKAKIRPPLDYMNDVGIKCPDYWTYVGNGKNGNYQCVNTFQLHVKDPSKCYSDISNKMMIFKALQEGQNWSDMSDDDRTNFVKTQIASGDNILNNTNRCDWTNKCGAVWLGVGDKC